MSYTRRQWATDLLHAIGNPAPTEQTIDFVSGWTAMETTAGGGASFNLLNTEQQAPGSSNFNPQGVQNYPTYTEGVDTNAEVLENGLYNPLLQALKTNDATALGLNGQAPSSGVQRSLTNWVKGPGYTAIDASYVNGVVSLAHSTSVPGQTFSGSSAGSGSGFKPQVQTDTSTPQSAPQSSPQSTTTTTTNSSGSDPFGIGSAVSGFEGFLGKAGQVLLLSVIGLVLVAIGLFLLLAPAASGAASQVEAANNSLLGGGDGSSSKLNRLRRAESLARAAEAGA